MATFEEAASMEVCYLSIAAWKYCGDLIIKPILGFPRADEKSLQEIRNELTDGLKAMDGILSSRKYLGGSDFTLVEIWMMPWVSQLIDLEGADVLFDGAPHLREWWERVSVRPVWQEAPCDKTQITNSNFASHLHAPKLKADDGFAPNGLAKLAKSPSQFQNYQDLTTQDSTQIPYVAFSPRVIA
ncbi:hypothetical protein FOXB_07402 [Fusarium oxysporum f. sp. conglutinans Fo5176]|uniref:glutathione transferase n=1 Tax=Fusarium oxysporum (strain Fo5176) TaxID=660025 RepID=F9FLX2_FUSOF|nr:hypothetical protein FOXB_07402 [Fusarium oxysporum f. sp. conglutinans Fo5176]